MESKYNQFLNYNWEDSEHWKNYFNNIFPIPRDDKINYYKRKYYKLKVDPDFDINYNIVQSNQSSNPFQRNHIIPSQTPSIQMIVESIFEVLFLMIFSFTDFSLKISIALLTIRIVSSIGFPKLTVDYLNAILFNSEDFLLIIYSFILMLENTTFFLYVPLLIYIQFKLLINVKKMDFERLRPYKKYINYIISINDYVFFYSHLFQLFLGVLLIVGIFYGLNSIFYLIIYWQYIKFSHCVSLSFQQTINNINIKINRIKESNLIPVCFITVIGKVQKLIAYVGTTNPQNTILVCEIF